jgi:hypothetical protein
MRDGEVMKKHWKRYYTEAAKKIAAKKKEKLSK